MQSVRSVRQKPGLEVVALPSVWVARSPFGYFFLETVSGQTALCCCHVSSSASGTEELELISRCFSSDFLGRLAD